MVLEENNDSADVFWPGYVDAVTNLVLNLLFMLTIMIVAVFMFALELSRHKEDSPTPVVKSPTEEVQHANEENVTHAETLKAKDEKIVQLEQQVAVLRKQALSTDSTTAVKSDRPTSQKVVIVKTPLSELDKSLQQAPLPEGAVIVHFLHEAVTLTESEADTVRKAINQIAAKGAAKIVVDVPAGFSEAKRIGYYRAMAIRNQLIELRVPVEKIDVSIREGKSSADNSKVLVMEQ